VGRHLTRTTFKELFVKGWIGTAAPQFGLLFPYIRDAMDGKRSVALAIETRVPDELVYPTEEVKEDDEFDSITAFSSKRRRPGQKARVIQL
jgi:hypothetical protein